MNRELHKTERIHALDSLRAIMMLLGLVLHSALTYNKTVHGDAWTLKDPNSSHIFSDALVFLIHSFRMPIFFVVAGFFGALLFYERRPSSMVKNRISRIVYPFIVFLFLLWPITIFAFGYTGAVFSLNENPLQVALEPFKSSLAFIPRSTSHLWFLYYLALISGATVIVGLLLQNKGKFTQRIKVIFEYIIQNPFIRILCLSTSVFLILTLLKTYMLEASVSLVPDYRTFIYYLFFYLIGWILFKSKQYLYTFTQYEWTCTILAIVLAIIQGLLIQSRTLPNDKLIILSLFSSVIVSLFIFGITGLCIRYGSSHSARMRYISDASYWVYLIHLPLTALIPVLIWELPMPAIGKFIIALTTTTIISFVSYHYLVRNTFIGKFLNGRKYNKNQ